MIVLAVLLVLGVRVLLARQGRRLNRRIEDAVTPENARTAALALTDEQHREVYRAIAAEDGRRALATFKQATGAGVRDCIIAVQALHSYPQRTPSELRLEDELSGVSDGPEVREELVEDAIDEVRDQDDDQASGGTGDQDDAGPDAGTDAGVDESRGRRRDRDDDGGPVAEADPYTGRILGPNEAGIPDIPGGEREDDHAARDEDQADATAEDEAEPTDRPESETSPGAADGEPAEDPEVEEKARRLLAESEFSLDEELTVPEEWTRQDAQEEPAGFHLEVQREGEKITLSHEDLEPWVHDQLYALLRDDHVTEAAQLLSEHSPLTEDEAHKFLVVFKNQG